METLVDQGNVKGRAAAAGLWPALWRGAAIVLAALVVAAGGGVKMASLERPSIRIAPGATFYVMLPPDAQYGRKTYPRSGASTQQAATRALAVHGAQTVRAPTAQTLDMGLFAARQANATYVFQANILNWEDRSTEWSGVTDKLSIQFLIYDARSGKMMSSAVMDANSKWVTLGGDHPQDMLPEMTKAFVDNLF